jgi:enolase
MSAIERVIGRRVWDSRGCPTIEVEVLLATGEMGRAIAPAGASTGSGEALDVRDGGATFGGLDVRQALAAIDADVAPALRGLDAADQAAIDAALIARDGTPDKSRFGANAMVATSMAAAHAGAAARRLPLWRHLGGDDNALLPLPEIQIFGGGAHAGRRVDIQDFMVMAVGASTFAEALDWTAEVYRAAGRIMSDAGRLQGVADEGGFWPAFDDNEQALECLLRAIERADYHAGDQIAISLDIAASELGKDGRLARARGGPKELDRDEMAAMLLDRVLAARDRARRLPSRRTGSDLARHRRVGVRQGRPLSAGASTWRPTGA